jgi:hypothetical protein
MLWHEVKNLSRGWQTFVALGLGNPEGVTTYVVRLRGVKGADYLTRTEEPEEVVRRAPGDGVEPKVHTHAHTQTHTQKHITITITFIIITKTGGEGAGDRVLQRDERRHVSHARRHLYYDGSAHAIQRAEHLG